MKPKYLAIILSVILAACGDNDKQEKLSSVSNDTVKSQKLVKYHDTGCDDGVTPHIDTLIVQSGTRVRIKFDVSCINNSNIYDSDISFGAGDAEIYITRSRDSYLSLLFDVNGTSKNINIYKSAFIDSIGPALARNGTFRYFRDIDFDPADSTISLTLMIMYTGTDSGARLSCKIPWNGKKIQISSVEIADEFDDTD